MGRRVASRLLSTAAALAMATAMTSAPATVADQVGGGRRLVYQSVTSGASAIVALDVDTGDVVRLTPEGLVAGYPVPSHDGSRIAFVAKLYTGGRVDFDLYTVPADGTDLRALAASASVWELLPSWSPDGRAIAFMSVDRDPASRSSALYRIGSDGTGLAQLTDGRAWDMDPAWSPDGTRIAFASDRGGSFEIYTVAADGDHLRQLTSLGMRSEQPTWSPDGSRLAFVSGAPPYADVYVVAADGSRLHRVFTQVGGTATSLAWSPDGRSLAFSAGAEAAAGLLVADLASGTVSPLTADPAGWQMEPFWSADGGEIAFTARPSGNWDVYTLRVDGSGLRRLTDARGEELAPHWLTR